MAAPLATTRIPFLLLSGFSGILVRYGPYLNVLLPEVAVLLLWVSVKRVIWSMKFASLGTRVVSPPAG